MEWLKRMNAVVDYIEEHLTDEIDMEQLGRIAMATVDWVGNYVKLTEEEIGKTLEEHQERLQLTPSQQKRWYKKCLCLVGFGQVSEIEPLEFEHQGNMDDWLILDKIEDAVMGTSIPYNYEHSRF